MIHDHFWAQSLRLDSPTVRAAILGFGLIGGSIALALAARGRGRWTVTAWSPRPEDARGALARGVLNAVAPDPETAIRGAELVILAAPPLANLELVDRLGLLLAETDATLTDVSSSQSAIAAHVARVPGLHFVGGHPMSGREKRGFAAARADLFEGRTWAILASPGARPVDVERVEALATACGAAPLAVDPEAHDAAVAAISHLPLVAAASLAEAVIETPEWESARRFAAQGWRDTTRLARGDPDLATGIVVTNAAHVGRWLRRYREVLEEWQRHLDALAAPADEGRDTADAASVRERFARVAALAGEDS
jgi:prephenate dehydrogenase